jgi:hypothetical protein
VTDKIVSTLRERLAIQQAPKPNVTAVAEAAPPASSPEVGGTAAQSEDAPVEVSEPADDEPSSARKNPSKATATSPVASGK